MNYIKSIFQAAVVAGGLALGSAASQAMPLVQSPGPAEADAATASNGIVQAATSSWCRRHPASCRRDYRRYRYSRRYYYPRYYGYRPYYYPPYYGYGYPYYGYGYYNRPRVGLWFGF